MNEPPKVPDWIALTTLALGVAAVVYGLSAFLR